MHKSTWYRQSELIGSIIVTNSPLKIMGDWIEFTYISKPINISTFYIEPLSTPFDFLHPMDKLEIYTTQCLHRAEQKDVYENGSSK